MTDPRTQDDSLDLLPSSPVVAAVAAALRAYYGDGPYHVVPVGGAAYAAIAAARPHLEEPLSAEIEQMTDRYGETLDLIATAVQTATDDTLRDSIRSMIRRVRPEALDLWSPTLDHRITTTEETDHARH